MSVSCKWLLGKTKMLAHKSYCSYIDSVAQGGGNSIANAHELPQACAKPLMQSISAIGTKEGAHVSDFTCTHNEHYRNSMLRLTALINLSTRKICKLVLIGAISNLERFLTCKAWSSKFYKHTPPLHTEQLPERTEAGLEAGWGSEFVALKKHEVGSFILLHKISRTACCFGIRTFLKQYNCYESATIWYTDHQYLTQYSEIINNLQEIPPIFCNYAVRSCGTWRKWPGQSPCNVLSISDLELYVTETRTGVCDPVTD